MEGKLCGIQPMAKNMKDRKEELRPHINSHTHTVTKKAEFPLQAQWRSFSKSRKLQNRRTVSFLWFNSRFPARPYLQAIQLLPRYSFIPGNDVLTFSPLCSLSPAMEVLAKRAGFVNFPSFTIIPVFLVSHFVLFVYFDLCSRTSTRQPYKCLPRGQSLKCFMVSHFSLSS